MAKRKDKKAEFAEAEYLRLTTLYTNAGVDVIKLQVNDSLIREVANTYGCIKALDGLPLLLYSKKNPTIQRTTEAGKLRVKYMAQYTAAMQKLNKELLGELNADDGDEDLSAYDDDKND